MTTRAPAVLTKSNSKPLEKRHVKSKLLRNRRATSKKLPQLVQVAPPGVWQRQASCHLGQLRDPRKNMRLSNKESSSTTTRAGPTCPARGLAEASLSPFGSAKGPLEESDVAKDLIEKQSKMIDEEVVKIQKGNSGKVGQIFKIAKQLKGEATNQAHAIKDPETKRLVVEQKEIKSISLKFCKKVLERNEPKKEMGKMFEMRKTLNEERLSENVG